MSHGVVVSPNFEINGSEFKLNCALDDVDIRRYLLYWDRMTYAFPNGLGKPNLDTLLDLKYLHDIDVLTLEDIPVTVEEVGKQNIQKIDVNALISIVKPTPENPSGILVLGFPASIWDDFSHVAQIKVAELNHATGIGTWTIGQCNQQLSLPYGNTKQANLFEAKIYAGLPVPSANTPLNEILEFKERRSEELIRFRHVLDQLYISILKSPDQDRELRIASEKIDLAVSDLYKCLNESNIKIFFDTLSLYINISDSKLFSTLIGLVGAQATGFPLTLGAAAGLSVNTMLTFTTRCINKPTMIPNDIKDFMYVYEVSEHWPNK